MTQFARSYEFPVSEEALAIVAHCVRSHVRDLEGAFKSLMALQSIAREPIDAETVARYFSDPATVSQKPTDAKTIRIHVAKYFGLQPDALASRSRKREVHYPRQIGMYLARKHTHASLESIGRLYNRGHASVLNALGSLEKKMGSSVRVSREVRFIEEKLLEKV